MSDKRTPFWAGILGAIALTPNAGAAMQRPIPNLEALDGLAVMNGTCGRLILGGRDVSSGCESRVTNSMYKGGRTGFTFLAGDVAVVTFSGADTPAKGNHATVRLDRVIFTLNGAGTKPNVVPASGTCTYTNPYAGPSRINCSASTNNGAFSASFVSDGEPPIIERF
ncbi:MAG TPA: hypothetical protein VGD10_01820 [Allosphingosinicella sp.]|uniref:hypothetical protein n=1 Tax=Allosphingosinicella sp. TaxID=2823234 RepID=UPI002EDB91DD